MIGMVIYGDKVPAGGVSNVVKTHMNLTISHISEYFDRTPFGVP